MQTSPTIKNQSLSANTEVGYDLPANTEKFTVKLREQNVKLQIAWVSGEGNTNYITIPANSSYTMEIKRRNVVFTIYLFATSAATAEIESWQN